MNNEKYVPISTVGRKRKKDNGIIDDSINSYKTGQANIFLSDSLKMYDSWPSPHVIISDGAYGILGFEGDTSNHDYLCSWYEKHIQMWSLAATAATTLWFWNTEIGWASVQKRYPNTMFYFHVVSLMQCLIIWSDFQFDVFQTLGGYLIILSSYTLFNVLRLNT